MLRLLLCPLVASFMAASPADDEPKPPNSPPTGSASVPFDLAFPLDQHGDKVAEDVESPSLSQSFTGSGQTFTVDLQPSPIANKFTILRTDTDLNLAAPDDALRSQLRLPKDRGLVVTSVRNSSSPWEAGVRENDILLTLDDAALAKAEDLDQKLKQAGEKRLVLQLLRKGKSVALQVQPRVQITLGAVQEEENIYLIGVSVSPLGPALRAQLGIPEHQGLVVAHVSTDSPAAKNDLKVNDVILTVGGQTQQDQRTLAELVQKNGDKPLAIEYLREGVRRTVQMTPEKRRGRLKQTRAPKPFLGSTVVRPGVVQFENNLAPYYRDLFSQTAGWGILPEKTTQAAAHDAKRLDEMSAEIKELRKVWDTWSVVKPGVTSEPNASAKRLDEMSAEIKELRKAIDGLRKALEDRK